MALNSFSQYRMPAEWEKHVATWLTWPTNRVTWPGKKLNLVESIYLQMIQALLEGERVHLLIRDKATAEKVLGALAPMRARTTNLIFYQARVVDVWIRDYGPIFLKHQKTRVSSAFAKFTFNAWGGKYSDLAKDNGVVDSLEVLKNFKRLDVPMVLEGGSIDVNGQGICLTTQQCLLNPNRNPKLSKKQIEQRLMKCLGVKKVIWLKEGIEADDTDGHVDDITRFVAANTIVTAMETSAKDKNHAYLKENWHILKQERNLNGKAFRLIELPMPGVVGPPRSDSDHTRLPASYANFYIGNAAVLLPIYSHANDRVAVKILKKLFPNRKIVPIECSPLVYGLGSIHCVTQQQPL